MNKKIKEIRIKNNWSELKDFSEKIFRINDPNIDISILSYRRYVGPYVATPNCDNEYTNIIYEVLITPYINKDDIEGDTFSEKWIKSINEVKKKKSYISIENKLNDFLKRNHNYDTSIEFEDINNNIFCIKQVHSFSPNEITFTENWIQNKDDFEILSEKNNPKTFWELSEEKYGINFVSF